MLPELSYFSDRALGPKHVPRLLREAGLTVVTHDDLGLAHDTPDVVWIPKVTALGHVILTADKHIRSNPLELLAVKSSGAWYFAIGRGHRSAMTNAEIILRHLHTVKRLVHSGTRPIIAQLNVGEVLVQDERGRLVIAKP